MRWFGWLRPRPAPPPIDFTLYRGEWVAVKAGKLVAHAPTARQMLHILQSNGQFAGSSAWYVPFSNERKLFE